MPGKISAATPRTSDRLPTLLLCGHSPGQRDGAGESCNRQQDQRGARLILPEASCRSHLRWSEKLLQHLSPRGPEILGLSFLTH